MNTIAICGGTFLVSFVFAQILTARYSKTGSVEGLSLLFAAGVTLIVWGIVR